MPDMQSYILLSTHFTVVTYEAGDPVFQSETTKHQSCGVLDTPLSRSMTALLRGTAPIDLVAKNKVRSRDGR
jgi:hypothetical protein